jgi:two-component system nitrate/nitrite response regulator NarL
LPSAVEPSDTRVLIVEDHALFAESLEIALRLEAFDVRRLDLASLGGTPSALASAALRVRARVALVDLDLGPYGDGLVLIETLGAAGSDVVVVTACADRAQWGACVQRGARKVLSKNGPLQEMLTTVHRLIQGLPTMTRDERDDLLGQWRRARTEDASRHERLARLTRREKEILTELVAGNGVHDIATGDVVSEATVRSQVKSILGKLEVSSQLAAVGLAHRLGWPPAPLVRQPGGPPG